MQGLEFKDSKNAVPSRNTDVGGTVGQMIENG